MRDLAVKAHVSRKTLQSISDGEAGNAGVGMLYDIAKCLGVAPEWLAYGAGDGGPNEEA